MLKILLPILFFSTFAFANDARDCNKCNEKIQFYTTVIKDQDKKLFERYLKRHSAKDIIAVKQKYVEKLKKIQAQCPHTFHQLFVVNADETASEVAAWLLSGFLLILIVLSPIAFILALVFGSPGSSSGSTTYSKYPTRMSDSDYSRLTGIMDRGASPWEVKSFCERVEKEGSYIPDDLKNRMTYDEKINLHY